MPKWDACPSQIKTSETDKKREGFCVYVWGCGGGEGGRGEAIWGKEEVELLYKAPVAPMC